MSTKLWAHSKISLHHGKTKIWNRGGICPKGCEHLQAMATLLNPRARVWRGDQCSPTRQQGLVVLGTPLGLADFVRSHLESVREEQDVLLDRIPVVPNLQAAWLLLSYCAATRANFVLRTVRPSWQWIAPLPRPGNLEVHDPDFGHTCRKCARGFSPDSITSIVHGRARTPECFTMSSWSSLGEQGRRN